MSGCRCAALLLSGLVFIVPGRSWGSISPDVVQDSQESRRASGQDNPPIEIVGLIQKKQWNEVVTLEEENFRKDPSNVSSVYWLGVARLQLRNFIGATQALRSAQRDALNTASLHLELGHAYYGLNQFVLFQQQMELASSLEPGNADPKYFVGLYRLTVLSDVSGALALFREATSLQPGDWKSLYQLGHCLELNGQRDEARQAYLRDIQLIEENHQEFGWPYQGMARLLIEENPEEALRFARKAVETEPGEYLNHFVLAKVQEKLGKQQDAIAEARAAVDQNPTDASLRYFLFRLYRSTGNVTSAKSELTTFEKLNEVYGSD
jgi:tetratricopeptide (TPR) repeat protein